MNPAYFNVRMYVHIIELWKGIALWLCHNTLPIMCINEISSHGTFALISDSGIQWFRVHHSADPPDALSHPSFRCVKGNPPFGSCCQRAPPPFGTSSLIVAPARSYRATTTPFNTFAHAKSIICPRGQRVRRLLFVHVIPTSYRVLYLLVWNLQWREFLRAEKLCPRVK